MAQAHTHIFMHSFEFDENEKEINLNQEFMVHV